MNTPVDLITNHVASKRIRRQLILFINLNEVNAAKKDIFVKFASERANCLKASYSAYNISLDENREFQAIDLKNTSMSAFITEPSREHGKKMKQIFDAKIRVMNEFKEKLEFVDEHYDYILVVGEMSRSSSGNSISNISHLEQLANYLRAIISQHSAKHVHLRVQVCFSNQVSLPRTNTSFASALVPTRKFVHLSAPKGWSIIGRNGTAIDYNLLHDLHFDAWAPFLSYIILNNLSLVKIKETFNSDELFHRKTDWRTLMNLKKERSEITIESLNISLHYPSKTSEEKIFTQLEYQSKNSFLPIESPNTSRSRPSSQSSLFREHSPILQITVSSSASAEALSSKLTL